jgi:hypothetical protein
MPSSRLKICFERMIILELNLQKYYLGIANHFSFDEDIRGFFLDLAADEGEHAQALLNAKKIGSGTDRLDAASFDTLLRLDRLQALLSEKVTFAYGDFAEAFIIVQDIEKSKINDIFLLLVTGMSGSSSDASSLRSMMNRHVQKVADLGIRYPAEIRAKIRPRL